MPHPSRPDRALRSPLRRLSLAAIGASALSLLPVVCADTIPVTKAELQVDEGDVLLSAEFDFALTPALEQALDKGIPLYFTIEFELVRTRVLWFSEKVAEWSITYRVSYTSLTRQYRVSSGLFAQTLYSLEEVQRFLSRVTSRPVARRDALQKGSRYEAAVRLRLDVNALPKPFQISALASRDWSMQSEWHRWSFTP